MYLSRLSRVLLVAFSIANVTQAAWFDFGVLQRNEVVAMRQDASIPVSLTGDAVTTSSPSAMTTAPTTSKAATTTSTDEPPQSTTTPAATTQATTSPQTPTTQAPTQQTTTSPTTNTDGSTTTSDNGATTSGGNSGTTNSETSATPTVVATTIVKTVTGANGQTSAMTSTGSATITPAASLNQNNNGSSSAGISSQTKSTIIGVCVGVGGAIVLAVVGLLIWRLRARRRNQEDNEDLVNYGAGTSQFNNGPEKSEASGSVNGRTPFQSTLESYHAPTQTNAASNF